MPDELVNVRYMVDDVEKAVDFYTTHFGFELRSNAAPAFADVVRGHLRLLLSGPKSSAGRPMPDGRRPEPGVESHPLRRRRPRRRCRATPRRRADVPKRRRHRPRRTADPARRPLGQPDRALPARRRLTDPCRSRQSRRRARRPPPRQRRRWMWSSASGDGSAASASEARRPTSHCCASSASSGAAGCPTTSSTTRSRPPTCCPGRNRRSCQQRRRKREPVGIDYPLQLVEARAEILLDHRQRDVDDGHVEQQHRRRRRYDAQRQPAPAGHAIVANAATRAIVP
jgi:catechol 2,3-dioxygenase-like lactoylglutathione lyase family enzyme